LTRKEWSGGSKPCLRTQTDAGEYAKRRVERAQAYVAKHLKSYVEFPPRQRPGTFALDAVLAKLQETGGSR
jgi:arylsulfatase